MMSATGPAAPVPPPGRRTNTPGGIPTGVNLATVILVLVLVVTLALRAASASPPAIAELSPVPHNPITQAPSEQSAAFGTGAGGSAGGLVPSNPSTSPSPVIA